MNSFSSTATIVLMQPDQTPQNPQAPQQNPYDFFMKPGTPEPVKSKLPIPLGGKGLKGKIMLAVGAGLVLLIITFLAATLLGGSKGPSDKLQEVVQEQTELIRVTDLAKTSARSTKTQVFATNVGLSLTTAKLQILPVAKKSGAKTDVKNLSGKQSSSTDKALKAATENNQFDELFTKTVTDQLTTYKKSLNEAYQATSNKKDKQTIKNAYDGAVLLLTSSQSN